MAMDGLSIGGKNFWPSRHAKSRGLLGSCPVFNTFLEDGIRKSREIFLKDL